MLTLRISAEQDDTWLGCEFCGTREYPHTVLLVGAPEHSSPAPEVLIRAHFALSADESYDYAPCGHPPVGDYVTEWLLSDVDGDVILARGPVRFSRLATIPEVTRW